MNTTEKLIMLVQAQPCLYDKTHKDYRNTSKKDMIWDEISKELNQSRESIRLKWKNLKDGYTKYKKQNKDSFGRKTYVNWVWGPYLQFLDMFMKPRTTSISVGEENCTKHSPSSNSPQADDTSSPVLLQETSYEYEMKYEIPVMSEAAVASDTPSTPMILSSATIPCTTQTCRKRTVEDQDMYEAYNLESKKKYDATDYLFASYAETFKKLKPRTQTTLKLKLAQIFAEAELDELNSKNLVLVSEVSELTQNDK